MLLLSLRFFRSIVVFINFLLYLSFLLYLKFLLKTHLFLLCLLYPLPSIHLIHFLSDPYPPMDPGFPVPVADPALLVHPDWLVSPVFLVFPAHLDRLVSPVFPVFPDPVDLLMAHPDPVWFHFPDPGLRNFRIYRNIGRNFRYFIQNNCLFLFFILFFLDPVSPGIYILIDIRFFQTVRMIRYLFTKESINSFLTSEFYILNRIRITIIYVLQEFRQVVPVFIYRKSPAASIHSLTAAFKTV